MDLLLYYVGSISRINQLPLTALPMSGNLDDMMNATICPWTRIKARAGERLSSTIVGSICVEKVETAKLEPRINLMAQSNLSFISCSKKLIGDEAILIVLDDADVK